MKNGLLIFVFFVCCFLNSCISIQDSRMGPNDSELKVLGTIETELSSFQHLHIPIIPAIKASAYKHLLEAAKMKYGIQHGTDVLDVKNISIEYDNDKFQFLSGDGYVMLFGILLIPFNVQFLTAKGTVVVNPNKQKGSNTQKSNININALEPAVEKIAKSFVEKLPSGSTIAVLNISGTNNAQQIIDELAKSFDMEHIGNWYADFKNIEFHYIIFPNKIFKLDRGKKSDYDKMGEYALSIGLPKHQLIEYSGVGEMEKERVK